MKINLKITKDLEKQIKEVVKKTNYDFDDFIRDMFQLGFLTFMVSSKMVGDYFVKGGGKFDKDISNLAR